MFLSLGPFPIQRVFALRPRRLALRSDNVPQALGVLGGSPHALGVRRAPKHAATGKKVPSAEKYLARPKPRHQKKTPKPGVTSAEPPQ